MQLLVYLILIHWKVIYQAPLVQTLDSAIQRISIRETNYAIHWIVIYPVDSAIQRLNNWGQVDSAIQLLNNLGHDIFIVF